jgi:hypothetical protein
MTRGDNDVTGTDDDATAAADGAKPNSSQTRVEAELCKSFRKARGCIQYV